MTIEVDPAYGKYHADGHRNCGVWMTPKQAKEHNFMCPKCGKELAADAKFCRECGQSTTPEPEQPASPAPPQPEQ